jgi:hypothetical protein
MNEITMKTPDSLKDGATMTSLEMVDFINATREPGEGLLRHDNFMQKVPKVLTKTFHQFEGMATWIANGGVRQRPTYNFPKREAYLMAISYSLKLQAMVYDAMVAGEAKLAATEASLLADPAVAAEAWAAKHKTYLQALRELAEEVAAKEAECNQDAATLCNP